MLEALAAGWLPQRHLDLQRFDERFGLRRIPFASTSASANNELSVSSSATGSNGNGGELQADVPQQPPMRRRRHRADQIEQAYALQRDAAVKGALLYTALGLASTFFAHHLFPRFRQQTLALKAFITSGFTIFGFVVGADTTLLNHEGRQRHEEDLIRGVARRELAMRGILASEREIEKWKDETRDRLLREREQDQEE